MARILLVEANEELARELEVTLQVHDHEVVRVDSAAEALVRGGDLAPDLVLVDAADEALERQELLDACRYVAPAVGVVVIARREPDEEWREVVRERCVSVTLVRPFRLGALVGAVRWAARAASAPA